ncbi:MAG: hypothetical protein ACXWT0_00185 [Methylobacter sp.]
MADYFIAHQEQIVFFAPIYFAIGLIVFFTLIRRWVGEYGYDGLDEKLTRILWLSVVGWPYVAFRWVLSWRIFTWKFWLMPIHISFSWPDAWWVE